MTSKPGVGEENLRECDREVEGRYRCKYPQACWWISEPGSGLRFLSQRAPSARVIGGIGRPSAPPLGYRTAPRQGPPPSRRHGTSSGPPRFPRTRHRKAGPAPQRFGGGFQFLGLDPQRDPATSPIHWSASPRVRCPPASSLPRGVIEKRQRQTRDESMNPRERAGPGPRRSDSGPLRKCIAARFAAEGAGCLRWKIGALSAERFLGSPPQPATSA